MGPRIINEYFDINCSIVQIQQYGSEKTLVPPQKDCTHFQASTRLDVDTPSHVIVIVPGNPGIVANYHDFNSQLLHNLHALENEDSGDDRRKVALLAISHNNFDYPIWNDDQAGSNNLHIIRDYALSANDQKLSPIADNPNQMELQIRNKIVILKALFDLKRTKFIFIGHSIGCYIILRMMQDDELNSRTIQAYLIHPTLENLALSDQDSAKLQLVGRMGLIKKGKNFEKLSPTVRDAVFQLSTYKTLQAALTMVKSEFSEVKDLQLSLIGPAVDRLKIFYAKKDHWVNVNHRQTLIKEYPGLHIEEIDSKHAFILDPDYVSDYASRVASMISEKLINNP